MKEEEWVKNDGYVAKSHKFIYSFVDDEEDEKDKGRKTQRKTKSKDGGNILSITHMTDEAISHRSRDMSSVKSDRSYYDDGS